REWNAHQQKAKLPADAVMMLVNKFVVLSARLLFNRLIFREHVDLRAAIRGTAFGFFPAVGVERQAASGASVLHIAFVHLALTDAAKRGRGAGLRRGRRLELRLGFND